ncbi:DnaJ domain-containing protein [Xylariales sp. AK1849]|nr:DnaJ domain-containing protein [Xylariales sp. AK1849]
MSYSKLTRTECYFILELQPRATTSAIKAAWRKLALRHHPDKAHNDPSANAKFSELQEAYEVLTDKIKAADDYNDPGSHGHSGCPRPEPDEYFGYSGSEGGSEPETSRHRAQRQPTEHCPSPSWYHRMLDVIESQVSDQLDRLPQVETRRTEVMKAILIGGLIPEHEDPRFDEQFSRIRKQLDTVKIELVTCQRFCEHARAQAGTARSEVRMLLDLMHDSELEISRIRGLWAVLGSIALGADRVDGREREHLKRDLWVELMNFSTSTSVKFKLHNLGSNLVICHMSGR